MHISAGSYLNSCVSSLNFTQHWGAYYALNTAPIDEFPFDASSGEVVELIFVRFTGTLHG